MICLRSTYLTCALLALFAVPAICSPVFFADRASWLTAVTAPSTVTFNSDPVQYYNSFTTGLSLPDNPTFEAMVNGASGYNLQIVPGTGPYDYGSLASLLWPALGGSTISSVLHVAWPTPVTAVGLDFMTYTAGFAYTAKITNNDSSVAYYSTLPTPGIPNRGFFGLTSDIAISSIDFYLPSTSQATPLIDNFSYGTASTGQGSDPSGIPEPRSFLLIASGLIGIALLGRRFQRKVAQVS